jgi:sulfide:quinone oxidoreductase
LAVLEPFAAGHAPRYSIAGIAADAAAQLVRDTLGWVDWARHSVRTGSDEEVAYDALLLAVGGHEGPRLGHARVFTGPGDAALRSIVEEVETGAVTSVAFVAPSGPSWPLPLYELALFTAHRGQQADRARRS